MRTIYGLMLLALLAPLPALSDSASNMQTMSLTKKCEECEFSGEDFSLKNFSGFTFIGTKFKDININNADFSNASIEYSSFDGGVGQSANFGNASIDVYSNGSISGFYNIDLRGSNFDFVSFSTMSNIIFGNSKLDGASFVNSYLAGANVFFKSSVTNANFSGASLIGSTFLSSDFSNSNFSGADLSKFKSLDVDLLKNLVQQFGTQVLSGDTLSKFINCNFEDAEMTNADISKTDFSKSNFKGANLNNSNLSNSNFSSVDFEGAVLTNVDLSGSDLSGANLKGANLTDATLTGTNLCNAIGPDGTKLFIGCP